ncbi:MAG: universal stress protein [Desulfovibrio sp.]|jgi:nucleotide-binding universal stress UspA family protein|nr:universal stress protein [Desulfovibrio sp.]
MSAFAVKKILCPIDFSPNSELVAGCAVSIAKTYNALLEFIFVSPLLTDIGGHQEIEVKALQDMEQRILKGSDANMDKFIKAHSGGVSTTGVVLPGNPAETILQRAKDGGADLIVIGTHGRKGFDHILFGSVAEKVVRSASVPVLVAR